MSQPAAGVVGVEKVFDFGKCARFDRCPWMKEKQNKKKNNKQTHKYTHTDFHKNRAQLWPAGSLACRSTALPHTPPYKAQPHLPRNPQTLPQSTSVGRSTNVMRPRNIKNTPRSATFYPSPAPDAPSYIRLRNSYIYFYLGPRHKNPDPATQYTFFFPFSTTYKRRTR